MRLKGVSYDVGRVPGMNWRPVFDADVAHEICSDIAVPLNGQARG